MASSITKLPVIIISDQLADSFISLHEGTELANKYGGTKNVVLEFQKFALDDIAMSDWMIINELLFSSPRLVTVYIFCASDIAAIQKVNYEDTMTTEFIELFDGPESKQWQRAEKKIMAYLSWFTTVEKPGITVYTGPMYAGKSTAIHRYNEFYNYPLIQPKEREKFEWSRETHSGKQFHNYYYFDEIWPVLDKSDAFSDVNDIREFNTITAGALNSSASIEIPEDFTRLFSDDEASDGGVKLESPICPMLLPQTRQWNLYKQIAKTGGICIDEFQFMNICSKSLSMLDSMAARGINIQIAILSGTFRREPWDLYGTITAMADKIHHLVSECYWCGRDAPFSKRVSGGMNTIELDKDLYVPMCRTCFLAANN